MRCSVKSRCRRTFTRSHFENRRVYSRRRAREFVHDTGSDDRICDDSPPTNNFDTGKVQHKITTLSRVGARENSAWPLNFKIGGARDAERVATRRDRLGRVDDARVGAFDSVTGKLGKDIQRQERDAKI